jgi:hypothetical protein
MKKTAINRPEGIVIEITNNIPIYLPKYRRACETSVKQEIKKKYDIIKLVESKINERLLN